jgi:CheY-like chemotaxis protein
MNRLMAKTEQFSFPASGLHAKLIEHIHNGKTGYWQHQFDRLADRERPFYWNLGIANGQIVYSGNRSWSTQMLVRVVERYIARIRRDPVKSAAFELLKQQAQSEKLDPARLLAMMKQSDIITEEQLLAALRIKILNDLDLYLLMGSGEAKFIANDIDLQLPIIGLNPSELLAEAQQRQLKWTQLRKQVPSMKLCPMLDLPAATPAKLADSQRRRIEALIKPNHSLNAIAEGLAKDNLEVAQMFAKLVKIGFVKFAPPQLDTPITVMVIDDSPVLLAQFQHWVSTLGYSVTTCQEANTAMAKILEIQPSIIFIDINMPEISGFELVKQIRQHPDLREIPLAILTGEQKLSNKWRAQWSGCEFLNKPLTPAAISDFQIQLEELIPRLLTTPVNNSNIEAIIK